MSSHKHCIFCGIEVPVPRPTTFSLICYSPLNGTTPDSCGHKYHAVIVGRANRETEIPEYCDKREVGWTCGCLRKKGHEGQCRPFTDHEWARMQAGMVERAEPITTKPKGT
jgi:hypothetical protein